MRPRMKRRSFINRTIVPAVVLCVLAGATMAAADEPVMQLWYGDRQTFGVPGIAQQWINVLGNVSDADGIASLSYSLNHGPEYPLTLGPDTRRLVSAGDFNIEIDHQNLTVGYNQVVITAVDSLGASVGAGPVAGEPVRSAVVTRVISPIVIDGVLDESPGRLRQKSAR